MTPLALFLQRFQDMIDNAATQPVEDEYSYREACQVRSAKPVDLAAHSVQITAPSKRRVETTRVYDAVLSEAAWARIYKAGKGGR